MLPGFLKYNYGSIPAYLWLYFQFGAHYTMKGSTLNLYKAVAVVIVVYVKIQTRSGYSMLISL